MNRVRAQYAAWASSVPRTRGDEPQAMVIPGGAVIRSPHARG